MKKEKLIGISALILLLCLSGCKAEKAKPVEDPGTPSPEFQTAPTVPGEEDPGQSAAPVAPVPPTEGEEPKDPQTPTSSEDPSQPAGTPSSGTESVTEPIPPTPADPNGASQNGTDPAVNPDTPSSNPVTPAPADPPGPIGGKETPDEPAPEIGDSGIVPTEVTEPPKEEPEKEPVLTFTETSLSVYEGNILDLKEKLTVSGIPESELLWSSSDEKTASVSKGMVIPEKEGKAVISVSAKGLEAKITLNITHKKIPVSKVKLSASEVVLDLKESPSTRLKATVTPENADDAELTWSSSDETVVKVSDQGVLTPVGAGTATVTAETANGKKASAAVTVTKTTVEVEEVTFPSAAVSLKPGETVSYPAAVSPKDAEEPELSYESSATSVVKVDENGKLTAVKSGSAIVTATAKNGKRAYINVKVVEERPVVETDYQYYYTQLSGQEKQVYDAAKETVLRFEEKMTDETALAYITAHPDRLKPIVTALAFDHPEYFHMDKKNYRYSLNENGEYVAVQFQYVMSETEYESAVKTLNKAIAPLLSQAVTADDCERAYLAYDFVKKNLEYDMTFSAPSYNPYLAYTTGKAVCEGYSQLLGYLFKKLGIESIQVAGEGIVNTDYAPNYNEAHQWTMARLNGEWYHFDPTWDDPTGDPRTQAIALDYFALTEKEMLQNHVLSGDFPLPAATATEMNYYVRNGLVLKSTDEDALTEIGRKAFSLTGGLNFRCTPEVYTKLTKENRQLLWKILRAVNDSETMYIYAIDRICAIYIEYE